MRAVRSACEELVTELEHLGWEFDESIPLHEPGVVTLEHLDALEHVVGPLPEVAIDFWLEVGGIDLSGDHPDWDTDELKPLVLEAPLDDFLEQVVQMAEEGDVNRLPVSPDFALGLDNAATVVQPGDPVGLLEHLRIVLLGHGGIVGWPDGPPPELVAAASSLPRF